MLDKRILEQDERRQASGAQEEVRWYTAKMAAAEIAVARGLTALVGRQRGGSHSLGANDGEQQQKEEGEEEEDSLTDEQRRAVQAAVSGDGGGVIITGGPGTGKTFIMRTVVELLRAQGVSVALAAPTGRAAQRLTELVGTHTLSHTAAASPRRQQQQRRRAAAHQAVGGSGWQKEDEGEDDKDENGRALTIHRLLEYNPARTTRGAGGYYYNAENPLRASVVVIDEASMLDIPLAKALLAAMPVDWCDTFAATAWSGLLAPPL